MLAQNIYCIEGDWETDLRKKTSILSGLEMMNSISNIDFIYKTAGSIEEVKFRLKDFLINSQTPRAKYTKYNVLYIATHGHKGTLYFNEEVDVLDLFEEIINDIAIDKPFQNKIIHLGSCLTMQMNEHKLKKLQELTGSSIISGYTKEISFLESTLFDVLYFNLLSQRKKKKPLIKFIDKKYIGFKADLGFTIY